MNRTEQIKNHGVDSARYPFASFCYGRGWKGHATDKAARDAGRIRKLAGGGYPQTVVADTATGKSV